MGGGFLDGGMEDGESLGGGDDDDDDDADGNGGDVRGPGGGRGIDVNSAPSPMPWPKHSNGDEANKTNERDSEKPVGSASKEDSIASIMRDILGRGKDVAVGGGEGGEGGRGGDDASDRRDAGGIGNGLRGGDGAGKSDGSKRLTEGSGTNFGSVGGVGVGSGFPGAGLFSFMAPGNSISTIDKFTEVRLAWSGLVLPERGRDCAINGCGILTVEPRWIHDHQSASRLLILLPCVWPWFRCFGVLICSFICAVRFTLYPSIRPPCIHPSYPLAQSLSCFVFIIVRTFLPHCESALLSGPRNRSLDVHSNSQPCGVRQG